MKIIIIAHKKYINLFNYIYFYTIYNIFNFNFIISLLYLFISYYIDLYLY